MTIREKNNKIKKKETEEELSQWKKLYIRDGRAEVWILNKQQKELVIQDHN